MLQSLSIEHYALIDQLHIEFKEGFSVITGETGAGKSIILGAIGLLLGQRADAKAIRNGETKCTVEGEFNISAYQMEAYFEANDLQYDGDVCILRREIHASGKSRAYINDSPVTLSQMKDLGDRLIDIHSQHQNLLLNNEDFQLRIVDLIASDAKELSTYKALYADYRDCCTKLQQTIEESQRNKADEDYLQFQLSQLDEAKLQAGEQEELEQEMDLLSHAEEIKEQFYKVGSILNGDEQGVLQAVKEALNSLRGLQDIYPATEELANRMESCYIEMKDIEMEVERCNEEISFNPERLEQVNERLNLIYSLQQKHHVETVDELISIADGYRAQLQTIANSDNTIAELTRQKEELHKQLLALAKGLTGLRAASGQKIQDEMMSRLTLLGMPNVKFQVEMEPLAEPGAAGMDRVVFLFSANKNSKLQPVASIASGGEIARVMLSLKAMIAGAMNLPTIIFDEIDTGVSGEIAEKMACIMKEMSGNGHQIISITHLPQIAALGDTHYKVYKRDEESGTTSHIDQLDNEQRVMELAHMLSGSTLSEAAVNNAKALLEHAKNK